MYALLKEKTSLVRVSIEIRCGHHEKVWDTWLVTLVKREKVSNWYTPGDLLNKEEGSAEWVSAIEKMFKKRDGFIERFSNMDFDFRNVKST